MTARLEHWATFGEDDPWAAPELQRTYLKGRVYDDPRFVDGSIVATAYIVRTEGRSVFTDRGEEFVLGERHPNYAAWMEVHGLPFDPANPVRMVSKRTVVKEVPRADR